MTDVLFITRKWAPAVGGMETYCLELTAELAREHAVDVIALPGRAGGRPPSALALAAFPFIALRRYLTRPSPPQALHVADLASWPLGLVALLRRQRPTLVISAHGTDASYPRRGGLRGKLYGAYLRLGSRLLPGARVIANSRATAEAAAQWGWQTTARVPLATRASDLPQPSGHAGHLLFAGRLIRQKGCRWLVEEVLPRLPEGIGLRIAGTVWDESERAALSHPRVTFLGPLDRPALDAEYRSALAVVMPNLALPTGEFEGFGLVAAEAAAAGGLVLAADLGGLRDAVLPDETGFLLPSGDAPAWEAAIREILGWDDNRRAAFLGGSMARARAYFAWERVARETAAVYECPA